MLTSWPLTWFPLCGELIKRRYDTWITDFLQLLVADTFFWWSILLASLRTLFAQSLVSKVLVGSWWVVNIIPLLDVDLKRKTFLARCMVPSIAWYPVIFHFIGRFIRGHTVRGSMFLRADMIWRISQMIFNHHKGEACPWLIVCLVRPSPRSHSLPTGWHHHSHCSASQALSGKKSETTGGNRRTCTSDNQQRIFHLSIYHHHSNNHHHRHHHNSDDTQCNPQGHHYHIFIIVTSPTPPFRW